MRLLTYTFGNTAQAVSTGLAAFLGGLALGAHLVGRWVDRRAPSIWIYGTLEPGPGVYCFFVPELLSLVTRLYVGLFQRLALSAGSTAAMRLHGRPPLPGVSNPKGNTLPYDTLAPNLSFLMRFRPPLLPLEMPLEGLRSENDKQLILGYVAEERGDLATAWPFFRRATRFRLRSSIARSRSAWTPGSAA